MLNYDINVLEEKYNVKLDDVQLNALSSLIHFVEHERYKNSICLSGKPGSGKTTLLKMLIDILNQNRISYEIATPTNKAKTLLGNRAVTIHSMLNLQPNLNILNFDARDIDYKSNNNYLPSNCIVIIDECSMINDDLYYQLMDMCKKYHNCII